MERTTETLLSQCRDEILSNRLLSAVARVEGKLIEGAIRHFIERDFTNIIVPHISKATGSCENIDTLFEVDFFGDKGYLVQTGQLYLEAFVPRLQRVYCIGPSFRAETKVDARHVIEFPLLEIEYATVVTEPLDTLIEYIEDIICGMLSNVLNTCERELNMLGTGVEYLKTIKPPFLRMTYEEAIKALNLEWGQDLKHKHEQSLILYHGNRPLFITHYPKEIKFFNMKESKEDSRVVNSTDLLLPYSGEAVGAAQREEDHDRLLKRLEESEMLHLLKERGGSISDFQWYLDLIKKEPVPHAGCGIGLNRVTQFILASNDIRACSAYPMNKEWIM